MAQQMKATWELGTGFIGDILEVNVDRKEEEFELVCKTEHRGINKLLQGNSVNAIAFDMAVIDEIIEVLHKAKQFYERGN